jgi:hypothetical protein
MNEKRKSEGKRVESIFSNERSRAQKLLDKCHAIESRKQLMVVRLGKGTLYLVPSGADIEKWKQRKNRELNKQYRHNDVN